jgi:hypothetical protein
MPKVGGRHYAYTPKGIAKAKAAKKKLERKKRGSSTKRGLSRRY